MNVKEFAALKKGDRVFNDMSSSTGEITEVNDAGVRVSWLQQGASAPARDPVSFAYPVNSTAWFHWRLLDRKSTEHANETPEQEAERLTRTAT